MNRIETEQNGDDINDLEIQIFPAIKCNVNSRGEKIYHLPFDRDYDRTKIINRDQGECYALTIKEAREKGFRRAYRL